LRGNRTDGLHRLLRGGRRLFGTRRNLIHRPFEFFGRGTTLGDAGGQLGGRGGDTFRGFLLPRDVAGLPLLRVGSSRAARRTSAGLGDGRGVREPGCLDERHDRWYLQLGTFGAECERRALMADDGPATCDCEAVCVVACPARRADRLRPMLPGL
jgi:hypothetical protein